MADLCNYPSEIDMDGQMFGGEHFGSPLRSPERRGESCIRPLCLIRLYAQKLRLHRAMLYAFRRSTRNPIREPKRKLSNQVIFKPLIRLNHKAQYVSLTKRFY
uniref:Uncharacterized protein n=2 Tax=Candidatus Kentrum sp. FM TaxID=2126340 RepID=A0A450TF87_9GAMM|nr:MAG: hypothetical protein BECKFM1743A_GA0114220_103923 [Candidatus Kentron sp. FM]